MKYPKWIDEYERGSIALFEGNVLGAFQPIDFYHFYPLWYDLWLEQIYQAIQEFQKRGLALSEAAKYFPVPSSMRATMQKLIVTFPQWDIQDKEKFRKVISFFVAVLQAVNLEDAFSLEKNVIHSGKEVEKIVQTVKWEKSSRETASDIGRLIMGMGALVNGLYNDVVTDMGWESYGSYELSNNQILLVRHFPNMNPAELWPEHPEVGKYKYKEVKIYTVYKNVECKIKWLGCHPVTKGSLVDNLIKYAIEVDGDFKNSREQLTKLKDYYLRLATEHYARVKAMDFETAKQKVLLQECFQLHRFFEFLGLEWHPTEEMRERVKGKALKKDLFPLGDIIDEKTYQEKFGIKELKTLFSND